MSQAWERHVQYYLDYTISHPEHWAWFDAEWPQIKHAWELLQTTRQNPLVLSYIEAFEHFLDRRGLSQEAIQWGKNGLVVARALGLRQREEILLNDLGLTYAAAGQMQVAITFYTQQQSILQEIGDQRAERNVFGNLGNIYYHQGDMSNAVVSYERALLISRELGDLKGEVNSLCNIGGALAETRETRRAIEYFEQQMHQAYLERIQDRTIVSGKHVCS